jgi:2-(1,2-epoxy-1,2-dihydrophenyl)acetyl-CoA isomerase
MNDPSSVQVERTGDTAHVVLSSPETGNALSLDVSCRLRDAMREVVTDGAVRTVVLRAAGPRFSVGGDLNGFRAAPADANLCDSVARPVHETIELMIDARQPVVCAVQGAVGGGALGLVLAADIVLAAESAVFRTGYTGSGLSPDCGVTWFLPKLVGPAVGLDLLLTNRRFDAAEARGMGLVSRVIADDQLSATVAAVVDSLRLIPVETLSETKRLLRRSWITDLHGHLEDEARTIGRVGDTTDAREMIAAFLDKREPRLSR